MNEIRVNIVAAARVGKSTVGEIIEKALNDAGIETTFDDPDHADRSLRAPVRQRAYALGNRGLSVKIAEVQVCR